MMLESVRRVLNGHLYDVGAAAAAAQVAGDRRTLAHAAGLERILIKALREVQHVERLLGRERAGLNLTRCEAIGLAVEETLSESDGGIVWVHAASCDHTVTEAACACGPRAVYVLPPDDGRPEARA
jgi:hypothetical protein